MSSLPYDYYPAVLAVLNRISQGITKTQACDDERMNVATFENYVKNNSQLQMAYVDAERRGHDAMADALLSPDNHLLYGQTNPQMAKIVSDNIKWYLAKRSPKDYGEKIEIKHEITVDRAITDAMDRAKNRALTIDADPVKAITSAVVADVIDVVSEDDALLAELLS